VLRQHCQMIKLGVSGGLASLLTFSSVLNSDSEISYDVTDECVFITTADAEW